jgi:hypothetical protein
MVHVRPVKMQHDIHAYTGDLQVYQFAVDMYCERL